jgi:LytTr DNA-binding domain
MANEFGSHGFVRTHRSWLVNARQMTAFEPEGSGDHTVHLPKLCNEKTLFSIANFCCENLDFCTGSDKRLLRLRKSGGAACPCSIFFDLPRRGEARLAIPQHSAIVAKARKGQLACLSSDSLAKRGA